MAANKDGRMPLLDHLRELRRRVVRSALGIFVGSIFGFIFYNQIIKTLSAPVCDIAKAQSGGETSCGSLVINGVLGPLNLQIKVALLTGIIITAPIWLYQLWAFIAPALHRKEKRNSLVFFVAVTPFFATGATLGYTTLPVAIKVLFGFTPAELTNLVDFDAYLDFVMRVILFFGLAFELPVFLVTFNLIGFLSGKAILSGWRWWIFGICVFIAGFTPSADPISMLALAIPLVAMYYTAGGIALLNDRRRARKASSFDLNATDVDEAAPIDSPESI